MKKKKIISKVFALLFLISAIFMISGCGSIATSIITRGTYLIPKELIKNGPYKGMDLYISFCSASVGNKVFISNNNVVRASNGAGSLVIEGAWSFDREKDGDKEHYIIKIKFHNKADISDLFINEVVNSQNMISGKWTTKSINEKSCQILTVDNVEYIFRPATSKSKTDPKEYEDPQKLF